MKILRVLTGTKIPNNIGIMSGSVEFGRMVDFLQDFLDKGDVKWRKPSKPVEDQFSGAGLAVDGGVAYRFTPSFTEVNGRVKPRIHSHSRDFDVVRPGDFDLYGKPEIPRSVLVASLAKNWDEPVEDGVMEIADIDGELLQTDRSDNDDVDGTRLVGATSFSPGWGPITMGLLTNPRIPFSLSR